MEVREYVSRCDEKKGLEQPFPLPTHGLKLCYMEICALSVRILKGTPRIVPIPMLPEPLLEHRAAFIGFVRSRLGDATLAEDLVQDCLLKALRAEHVPADAEGVVTWFYRVLRHAIIDVQRRRNVRGQALEKLALDLPLQADAHDERTLCQCVLKLLPALPATDAELLRRIDLEGESATDIALERNQRVNTLNVRLLRARRRLRDQVQQVCRACATHGCLDCDCA